MNPRDMDDPDDDLVLWLLDPEQLAPFANMFALDPDALRQLLPFSGRPIEIIRNPDLFGEAP